MWKRKVDNKMRDYGEIDYDKKLIKINKKKFFYIFTFY